MKRNKLIVAVIVVACLVAALLGAVALCWHYLPMPGPTSPLVEKSKDNPHIQATYLHTYRVNDTLAVDATLLQALDSLGWETLKADFNVKPAPSPVLEAIDRGEDIVSVGLSPQNHPEQPMDTTDILRNNVMAISWLHHAVSIFYTHTQQEIIAVFESKYQHE